MAQRAGDDIAHELEIAARVRAVAAARRHAVFVQHAQRTVAHVARVDVFFEGEGVPAIEPAKTRVQAFARGTDGDHSVGEPRGRVSRNNACPGTLSRGSDWISAGASWRSRSRTA